MNRLLCLPLACAALAAVSLQVAAHDWRNHYATEISYRVVNVANWDVLNMRAGPSARDPIVGALKPGEGGILIQTCAHHATWCRVSARGLTGWVSMRFLAGYADTPAPRPRPRPVPRPGAGAAFPHPAQSWGGSVRSGPGMQHGKVASLQNGEPITILEQANAPFFQDRPWFRIRYRGRVGFQWGGIICPRGKAIPGTFQVCN
ncbi:MAG: SH3 domain-containing protein [Methyloligellaceae bacterium]